MLNEGGFGFATHFISEARSYGSPVPRNRLWWVALRQVTASNAQCCAYFSEVMSYLKQQGGDFITAAECLDFDAVTRISTAQTCKLPLLVGACGVELRPDTQDRDYKMAHYDAYAAFDLHWPPELQPAINELGKYCFAGCTTRQAELLFFCDTVWPWEVGEREAEFLDLNPNSVRILSECLDMNDKVKVKSPWRPHPMTLVGKTRLAC
eukprot:5579561-Karenia_brevis.AAC.1